ncbi:MAG: Ig-like domain-containing protein [Campylobacterota bacterium]|nr:Ig-like domain-containing protein [Campylobacterota bacterium]
MVRILLLAVLAFFIVGCGDDASKKVKIEASYNGYIVFDSDNGNIPYPNNILFAGSTDGSLNIPYKETDSDASVKFALNTLDGYSTTSPISIGFTGDIDPNSLMSGLKVYEIDASASVATGGVPIISAITADLTFGVDYVTAISGDKIVVLPIKTLKSNQNYMVVLTTGVSDSRGTAISTDIASGLLLSETPLVDENGNSTGALPTDKARTLEGIRQSTQAMIAYTIAQKGISREDIVTAWSFKTQTLGEHFSDVKTANIAGALVGMTNTGYTTAQLLPGAPGLADIWVGAMANLPYYLGTPSQENPFAAIDSYFVDADGEAVFDGMPALQDSKIIPTVMTIPNETSGQTKPATGWPVVIFQHGITQNRTNVLAIADILAYAGYATIAIDLPLHGITNNTNPFFQANNERTFDIDYINNATGASGPDGITDGSGTHYINLASLLTARDNVRQSASDLLALKNAIDGFDDLNGDRVAFVGHSLGTIASFGFLSQTALESVTLAMPGGGVAEILNNSPEFAPLIEAGLAAKGVIKGTAAYSSFMLAAQTILDDGDSINYTTAVATTQAGKIFAIEVVGDGTEGSSDQIIPNVVHTAPLAGTEPLVRYLGTTNLTADSAPSKTARFTVGDHGSILNPEASYDATVAMQTQMATFIGSQGTFIPVVNESILQID